MSAIPAASAAADERTPPKKTGETGGGVITATATSTAAAELDVTGAYVSPAYYSFQSVGADTYIWFKKITGAASLTTGGGVKLLDGGAPQEFYLTVDTRYLEHIASAVGTLRWWRSSPVERDRA